MDRVDIIHLYLDGLDIFLRVKTFLKKVFLCFKSYDINIVNFFYLELFGRVSTTNNASALLKEVYIRRNTVEKVGIPLMELKFREDSLDVNLNSCVT